VTYPMVYLPLRLYTHSYRRYHQGLPQPGLCPGH
jgi:hypothetical protein